LDEIKNVEYDDNEKVHIRTPSDYSVEKLGDRENGLLGTYTDKSLGECAALCTQKSGCYGISYKTGECELKKEEGLASDYTDTGKQFLFNESMKPVQNEVFHITKYDYTRSEASEKCQSLGARLATEEELTAAHGAGADWCSTGWDSDNANAGYPINTTLMEGCSPTAALVRWTHSSGKAGANCYGLKPTMKIPGAEDLLPWNASKWSQHD
jgi:hypothetical protein